MTAKYILAALSVVFLTLAVMRLRAAGIGHPQVRAWLIVGSVFAVVSAWLFVRG
jgi:hypothetical protein